MDAILRDQRTVLTVSTPMRGTYGVTDIALSLPTVVGRQGAIDVLNLTLTAAEHAGFAASAHTLRDTLAQVAPYGSSPRSTWCSTPCRGSGWTTALARNEPCSH